MLTLSQNCQCKIFEKIENEKQMGRNKKKHRPDTWGHTKSDVIGINEAKAARKKINHINRERERKKQQQKQIAQ